MTRTISPKPIVAIARKMPRRRFDRRGEQRGGERLDAQIASGMLRRRAASGIRARPQSPTT